MGKGSGATSGLEREVGEGQEVGVLTEDLQDGLVIDGVRIENPFRAHVELDDSENAVADTTAEQGRGA